MKNVDRLDLRGQYYNYSTLQLLSDYLSGGADSDMDAAEGERSRSLLPAEESEFGTNKAVNARLWPWLEPFVRQTYLTPFSLFPASSAAKISSYFPRGVGFTGRRFYIVYRQVH